MEQIFYDIGAKLIPILISFLLGGAAGYQIGIKSKISQSQKGNNNITQTQIGNIIKNGNSESRQ